MNSLDVLEKFSLLCNELDASMNEENRELRTGRAGGSDVRKKEEVRAKLADGLASLRAVGMVEPAHRSTLRDVRARLLQKLLKLLLLSRESEQLLLRNLSPVKQRVPMRASATQLRSVYQSHAA